MVDPIFYFAIGPYLGNSYVLVTVWVTASGYNKGNVEINRVI